MKDDEVWDRLSPEEKARINQHMVQPPPDACPRCGRQIRTGMWPWCKGDPKDHEQPHYGWHFAEGR